MDTKFINHRDEWILEQCKGKKVLHLGCTDWPMTESRIRDGILLHAKLATEASRLVGVDPDVEGIQTLSGLMPGFSFVACKAEEMQKQELVTGESWDIILAADVLEHVSNVGLALDSIAALMAPHTQLIITTPSAYSLKRLLGLLVLGTEHVHPDHCYYFSRSTLAQCLGRSGLEISQFASFMWRNPTFKNRLLFSMLLPINLLTKGRMADEVALIATKGK